MQLVAYGAQDIYLTGNPQITFFKVVYRRHTNFAMESIEQTFNGVANFGNKVVCVIARNGDLVGKMVLEVDIRLTSKPSSIRGLGHKLIKSVEIEIGGQKIDKHYGEWLDIWTQMSCDTTQRAKKEKLINASIPSLEGTDDEELRKLYIPLQFWFNRNPGLALPLIALQYHEVRLEIEFNKMDNISWVGTGNVITGTTDLKDIAKATEVKTLSTSGEGCLGAIEGVCLFCDYIFLDTDERRRFAQVSHEYLIDQLQTTCASSCGGKTNLNIPIEFNHPVKALYWVAQSESHKNTYDFTADHIGNPLVGVEHDREVMKSAKLQLNGQDRITQRDGSYFRLVQPWQHTGRAPIQGRASTLMARDIDGTRSYQANPENGYIYMYSFGLKPLEHQPSGTCNFSRIDNANLVMQLNQVRGQFSGTVPGSLDQDVDVRVYAHNYNVLRIMSGMGGLAYSN